MVKVIDNSNKPKTLAERQLLDIATYVMTGIDFAEDMIIEQTEREQEAYYEGYSRALINLRRRFFKEVK